MESRPFSEGTHIGFADDMVRANLRFSFKDRGESAKVLGLRMARNLDISLTIANPQASSPRFSPLPAEIRGLMYSFVVHFQVIHIKNRLG